MIDGTGTILLRITHTYDSVVRLRTTPRITGTVVKQHEYETHTTFTMNDLQTLIPSIHIIALTDWNVRTSQILVS
jgi:hypothetical protein